MTPLADLHVHLLAGLDDGPRTAPDAVEMCRMLRAEGAVAATALAHQNEHYPDVTPDRIRAAARDLVERLRAEGIDLEVHPTAEVMAHAELEEAWAAGRIMSVADRREYLLIEMPHGLFVDLRPTAKRLGERGVRLILAHPERQPELLHEAGAIEELIGLGCLVQVSSGSVTDPRDGRALRDWFRRGCVHLIGSDGHSPRRRPPRLAEAYRQIVKWVGEKVADRICGANGLAVLRGEPLMAPPPRRRMTLFGLPLW